MYLRGLVCACAEATAPQDIRWVRCLFLVMLRRTKSSVTQAAGHQVQDTSQTKVYTRDPVGRLQDLL